MGSRSAPRCNSQPDALSTAVDDLAGAGGDVPGLAGFAGDLQDLVLDWLHLDEFAGAVAAGFAAHLASNGLAGSPDAVHTIGDDALADHLRVGYADRDRSIRLALLVAANLRSLRERAGVDVADIERALDPARIGMYDPAFAVTLSESLGVDGYVDVVTLIRETNHAEHGADGTDDALGSVAVLATILTTALGRARIGVDDDGGADGGNRRDDTGGEADARNMPDDQVLDAEFVDDLVSGNHPGGGHAETDLSVLLGMSDPPTAIAVDIANHRLSPLLHAATLTDLHDAVDLAWGDRSGIATNYAEMLGRNPDASAKWLVANPPGPGGANLDLVLRQDGDLYIDDGRALASIVENGVTHPDIHTRHDVVEHAITTVGAEGDLLDNRYLPDALAKGAAADMAFLDHLINVDWDQQHLSQLPPGTARHTHGFLREIMLDESAANRVYAALETYTLDQLSQAPPAGIDWTPGDGIDNRTRELWRIGSLQGTIVAAEGNAYQDSAEAYLEAQNARASALDFMIGLAPYGAMNDLAAIDTGVGELVFPSDVSAMVDAEAHQSLRDREIRLHNAILLALAEHPARTPPSQVSGLSADEKVAFVKWARGYYDSADHNALGAAYGSASSALRVG